jgi:hypothetical protein
VAAGEKVGLEVEPLPGERPLEPEREEAVVLSGHDADGESWPSLEVADRPKGRFGLGALVVLAAGGHLARDVVEEVDAEIELGPVAASFGRGLPGPKPSGVFPPGPRSLTRQGDHRVHEDDGACRNPRGDEGHRERAQRLTDEHDVGAALDRVDDLARALGEAGALVVAGQVDGNRLMPRVPEPRHHSVPVPGGAPAPGMRTKVLMRASPRRGVRSRR